MGGVFVTVAAAVAAVALTFVSGGAAAPLVSLLGETLATTVTYVGAVGAAVTACDIGYKVGTGQTLHTGDWVNAGAAALPLGAGAVASACGAAASTVATVTQTASAIAGVGKGIYQASQGDYIGAAVSFGGAALSGVSAAGVGTAAGTNNLTGWGYAAHGLNLAANTANVIDKGIKIAEGDGNFGDWLSLGLSGVSAYMSGSDLYSGTSEILKNNPVKERDTDGTVIKPDGTDEKPDATKPTADNSASSKPAAGQAQGAGATAPQGGASGSTPAAKVDQTWVEKGFDWAGDFVGDIVELPGKVIGGVSSFIGEDIIGTDNMFGKGLDYAGDWISGVSDSIGNGVNSFIDGTGTFIVSPIETTKGWFKDTETPAAGDNGGATATQDATAAKTESTGLKWLGEKVVEGSKYVGGKIVDGATSVYDTTVDIAVGTYDAVSNGAYIYNQTMLPTDAFNSLDFAVNKALGKYDEDEEIEVYIV